MVFPVQTVTIDQHIQPGIATMPPPVTTRQMPTNSTRSSQTSGVKAGILARAVDVEDVDLPYPSILMYGGNRVGKTTVACKFEKPLLLVSFEPAESGGMESVRKEKGVKYMQYGVHFKDTNEAVEIAVELKSGKHQYKWIVIDSATSLQSRVLQEILNLPEIPASLSFGMVDSAEYRQRSEKTKEILNPFINLKMGRIILAKEKDHNPPKEERISEKSGKVQPDVRPKFIRGLQQASFIAADLGGGTAGWLNDTCDCICRLSVDKEVATIENKVNGKIITTESETGKFVRYLRTAYHPNFAAGIRSANPDEVPEFLVDATAEGLAQKLMKLLRG